MQPAHKASIGNTQRYVIWLGILPLLLAFFAYRTSSEHVARVAATMSTEDLIRQLDELLSTAQDAETGQRGYLLTGDPRYLAPFDRAIANLPARLAAVHSLAPSQGISATDLAKLDRAIKKKIGELQLTINLRRRGNTLAAMALVNSNEGERYMMQIRALVSQFKEQQSRTLGSMMERQQKSQLELEIVLVTGVLIGFLLVYTAYRLNRAYVRERDFVELEIRAMNESLDVRVKGRTAELEARTRELEERTSELQRSNADLTQFAYIASHDLQEPLRMVGSYMGLLARRYGHSLDETAQHYISFAVDGANRMRALIDDLLVYSRAGLQTLEKTSLSSQEIVRVALENLALQITESSAIVHYENLPLVEADRTKLIQVMQNLIGNALKFHREDVRPEVSITAERADGEWLFAVADNGIGFEAEYGHRIFQVFQRLHGSGKYPGTGIGLAICKRIIEHHGGRLWATSELGAGSTFYFTLPFASDVEQNQRSQAPRDTVAKAV